MNEDLSPNLPEINLDIRTEEVVAKPRKLKAKWSAEAADDLRTLLHKFQPGAFVLHEVFKRVVEVLEVVQTYDMVTGKEPVYRVADVLSGAPYTCEESKLGEPLNEMEVLAHIRAMED